jgi:hypothetical protein
MLWTIIKMLFGFSKKQSSEVKNFKKLSKDTQRKMLEDYVKKN